MNTWLITSRLIVLEKSEVDAKKSEVDAEKSEVDSKKSAFDVEKSVFDPKKSAFNSGKSADENGIADEKNSLDTLMRKSKENSYNITVLNNMEKVYSEIITDQVFGASDIEKILGCAESTAAEMMRRLRDMKVVLSINGIGKGKYRFKYESEME